MPDSNAHHAFITGVTGQDGYYLSRLLLGRGYRVTGGVHQPGREPALQLKRDLPGLELVGLDLLQEDSIRAALESTAPDRVFHLAGMSSVTETWKHPAGAFQVNAVGTVHLLEAMRCHAPEARLVFAGSGDCFDHEAAGEEGIRVKTPILATNPYAISKIAAMKFVECYRAEHGLHASIAVLMNHTSPRRPHRFVEMKIVHEAVEIHRGRLDKLVLGSLETRRDWSWAEDVVEGLAAMAEEEIPGDYVLASGRIRTTGDWVRLAFERLGLDPEKHVTIKPTQLHPGDRPHTYGNIEPARRCLGWAPRTSFESMVEQMIDSELGSVNL